MWVGCPGMVSSGTTSIGLFRSVLVPSAISPSPLYPQQYTPCSRVVAQVKLFRADRLTIPLPARTALASTGAAVCRSVVVRSPSWLYSLLPQQYTMPAFDAAQVCALPTVTWVR